MSTMNWSTLHELEERMHEALDKGQVEEARMLRRSYDKMQAELRRQDDPMRIAFAEMANIFGTSKC